ncbi:MAG: glutathione S-transferase family protein, partial [Brevundimonas sp.]
MTESAVSTSRGVLTVFAASPDQGRGLARDMAVRWALEEIGRPYEVRTVALSELRSSAHLARQPFGQIPAWEEDDVRLFESGAIVLHLAQAEEILLPTEPAARARVLTWMFAAAATVEPALTHLETARRAYGAEAWLETALAPLIDTVARRLEALESVLGSREWLEDRFSAADILMIQVLRRLEGTDALDTWPALTAWVERGKALPAYQRAFEAQKETWRMTSPEGA